MKPVIGQPSVAAGTFLALTLMLTLTLTLTGCCGSCPTVEPEPPLGQRPPDIAVNTDCPPAPPRLIDVPSTLYYGDSAPIRVEVPPLSSACGTVEDGLRVTLTLEDQGRTGASLAASEVQTVSGHATTTLTAGERAGRLRVKVSLAYGGETYPGSAPEEVVVIEGWRALPPFVVKHKPPKIKRKLHTSGGHQTAIAEGGRAMLVTNGKRGARVISKASPRDRVAGGDYIDYVAIGADGRYGVISDQRTQMSFLDMATGEVLARSEGRTPRFVGNTRVQWRYGPSFESCAIWEIDLAGDDRQPRALSDPKCDNWSWTSLDGSWWVVGDRKPQTVLTDRRYKSIRRVEAASGASEVLLEQLGEGNHLTSPRLTPEGDKLCVVQSARGISSLLCLSPVRPDGAIEVLVQEGAREGLHFDASGTRLLYTVADPQGRSVQHIADFEARTTTSLGPEVSDYHFRFMPGARRMVGQGGSDKNAADIMLLDLERGWTYTFKQSKEEEWQGVSPIPGVDDALIVGKERGPTRDLFWITIGR